MLQHVAHCRSGDKGNTSNIAVIAYEPELYPLLKEQLTAERFKAFYAGVVTGEVTRYEVDGLQALNFVAQGALGGGVSRSLCLDNYGKALSARVLAFELDLPDTLTAETSRHEIGDPMATILGSGQFRYEVIEDWAKLPDGWLFKDVAAVAIDHKDRVYVFNRGEHPMIVFDRDGNFLRSWGEGVFNRAHGLHIGPDESLYCTDDGDHSVRKCTLEGKVLLTIGIPGKPSPYMSGEPFHRCTHTALSPRGDIYVSDGYGNSRIHHYSPDGRLLKSWGESGTGPGQFNIPHNMCCDPDGWIYVADRENHRVQVFDGNGKYETEWHNLHRPCGMFMESKRQPLCYIGEIGPTLPINRDVPNLGPRISILDHEGNLLSRFGAEKAGTERADQFVAPHGMAVDSRGDLYVGEVSYASWTQVFPDREMPKGLNTLRKLVRVR